MVKGETSVDSRPAHFKHSKDRVMKQKEKEDLMKEYLKLQNQTKNDMALRNMRKGVKMYLQDIKQNRGPTINDQSQIVSQWWRELATQFNPDIHYKFVTDIPLEMVTNMLVIKGVVPDKH